MKKILIVTTNKDSSLPNLRAAALRMDFQVEAVYYDDPLNELTLVAENTQFDYVYFRDPFNVGTFATDVIRRAVAKIYQLQPTAQYIDNTKTYDDILIEDKWLQYQRLSQFMPHTELLLAAEQFKDGRHIAKERLSSRARGIVFTKAAIKPSADYVIQELQDVQCEYRVYGVHDRIVPMAALRSSKTADSKVKLTSVERLPDHLQNFAETVYHQLPELQLIGLDIIETVSGQVYLIEVNRSCQFSRYQQESGTNVAQLFFEGL